MASPWSVNLKFLKEYAMSSIKEQIKADLKKAQLEGQTRSENIKNIFQTAMSEATQQAKEGTGEVRSLAKDAIATLLETLKGQGKDLQSDLKASVEGLIAGISHSKRTAIAENEQQIQQLEIEIDQHQAELDATIDGALSEISTASPEATPEIKASLQAVVEALKESEEASLLRKRYAQLQAQLAVLRANLAARHGERFEQVEKHLQSAKTWYENAKVKSDTPGDTLVSQKQAHFEAKIGEIGTAIARREQKVKVLLKELWQSITEPFED
jgi:hypothetical protein